MPLLKVDDHLPSRPQRVLVAGASGSGKTTVGRLVAQALGVTHVEIDALFHGPQWSRRETFEAEVYRFSAEPSWVAEWQYAQVQAVLGDRADLLVWLDLHRSTVMRQVILRTLRRRLRREALWSGNVEPPLRTVFTNSDHIVRWAWVSHAESARKVRALQAERPELVVVQLKNRRAVDRWLEGPLRIVAGDERPQP